MTSKFTITARGTNLQRRSAWTYYVIAREHAQPDDWPEFTSNRRYAHVFESEVAALEALKVVEAKYSSLVKSGSWSDLKVTPA